METGRNPKNISAIYDYFDNIYYGIVYYAGWLGSEPPVLITLADFYAIPRDKYIKLIWSTASEIENAGFNILKAESEKDEYVMINGSLIPAIGSPIQGENYEFIDIDVVNDKTYYYLLEDIDIYGLSTMHGPVSTALKKE